MRILFSAILLFNFTFSFGQAPVNDNFENAEEIIITDDGFDLGIFKSSSHDITFSSKEKGELCAKEIEENCNCDKTVWFKFYIPTTRDISIKLSQEDSAIPQIYGAFNAYKTNGIRFTHADLEKSIIPLNKFGQSGNTCLAAGWYFIQAGFKYKASGKIWIEIAVNKPLPSLYDTYDAPYDFGMVADKNTNKTFRFECAAIENPEFTATNDSLFSKSIFISFTIPANSTYSYVSIYNYHSRVKYRVFVNQMNQDSAYGLKKFETLGNGNFVLKNEFCNNSGDVKYFIQLLGEDYSQSITITINNKTENVDYWNNPNTNDIIQTYNGFSRTINHFYNCSGLLYKHGCKNIIPDFYTYQSNRYGNNITDTFELGGYTLINVNEAGVLKVSSLNNHNSVITALYVLYEGNIHSGCNLVQVKTELTNEFSYCVKPGTYTLVTAQKKNNISSMSKHRITQSAPPAEPQHYTPSDPELAGRLSISPNNIIYSKKITFRQIDTTLTIDTFKRSGSFIFREFEVAYPGNLKISELSANYSVKYYLFKGSFRLGNIQLIHGMNYPKNSNSRMKDECSISDLGIYTLVSVLDSNWFKLTCEASVSATMLILAQACASDSANHPTSAIKINNLKDIVSSSVNKKNLDYVYPLNKCIDCSSAFTSPTLLHRKQQIINPETRYTYFVFYTGTNVEFRTDLSDYNYELYKGNSIQFPEIIKDTNNIVSHCPGNIICNLQGGSYYTMVLINVSNSQNANIYFTPHLHSPNDYAQTAYDLGHFNSNTSKSAPQLPITCHTGSSASDPCGKDNSYVSCPLSNSGHVTIIPYKDTLNLKRPYTRKNIWYTFTAENSGRIRVNLQTSGSFKQVRMFSVFRYKGSFEKDFDLLKAKGLDSTNNSLQWIATNRKRYTSIETRYNYVEFNNMECGANRYFIIVEDDFQPTDQARYNYAVTVSYSSQNNSSTGDICSDPAGSTISGINKQTVSTNNTCHTFGNSPFESYNPNYRSSWIKVRITDIDICDLNIRYSGNVNLSYFNVYGGDCGNLTRIAHVKDSKSYFTLSCMGAGDYFIQAVSHIDFSGNVTFEVETLTQANPKCKSYDFRIPIAQFKLNGGCMNDTVRLTNFSSDGSDIQNIWFINYKYFTNERNPVFTINNPLIKPGNNIISLYVRDTLKETMDSFVYNFQPDTTNYNFKIFGPDYIRCLDSATLEVKTDFPYKINYTWYSPQENKEMYDQKINLNNVHNNRTYYVHGQSDNCIFRDTFQLNNIPMDLYRDTTICNLNSVYRISTEGAHFFYVNNKQVIGDSFEIMESGLYALYYNIRGCNHSETLKVVFDSTMRTIVLSDTLEVCNLDKIFLKHEKYRLSGVEWNNGELKDSIQVNGSGHYILRGNINSCTKLEHHMHVRFTDYSVKLLSDTTYCFNDPFRHINIPDKYALLYYLPEENFRVKQDFVSRLKIRYGYCTVEDSARIKVFKSVSHEVEMPFCDSVTGELIKLEAFDGNKYSWIGYQDSSQSIQVKDFGTYYVKRINYEYCIDTLTFVVFNDCPFLIHVPDAFSPTEDNRNEIFQPVISGPYRSYNLTIYNRWGETLQVLDSKGWDGKYQNRKVQQDVYAYLLTVIDKRGRKYFLSGTFTLLR